MGRIMMMLNIDNTKIVDGETVINSANLLPKIP